MRLLSAPAAPPLPVGAAMKLLLVESSHRLSLQLRQALGLGGFAVDALGTLADADQVLGVSRYDVAVINPRLPDGDALDLVRRLRVRGDATPIFLLTADHSSGNLVAGLNAGADDCAVMPIPVAELIARLRALLRRSGNRSELQLGLGNLTFDTAMREAFVAGRPLALLPRELAILEFLLRRRQHVIPKQLLTGNLYGLTSRISANAAEVYVHRLRRRLQAAGATARIVTRRGIGYSLVEGSEPNADPI